MGLNAAPVRRLRRSWELVSAQDLAQLSVCEAIIDPHRNFKNYHEALTTISPPCVPYIGELYRPLFEGASVDHCGTKGVFLRTLLFIQKGSPDFLPNDVVNFTKHRRVADVIIDIRRWQSKPHNFHPVPSVLAFLEESLQRIKNGEFYWNLSLMREPPESWGDRLVRLSVEKGIL
jgi:son of sevenless